MKTLLIDNYDSFTFNLYQAVAALTGEAPLVVRNDERPCAALAGLPVARVILSPGPGRPDRPRDFGVCAEILQRWEVPILGVCLGCQGIATAFGGRVQRAPEPMHGRLSRIHHDGTELFRDIPQDMSAVRYHSLAVVEPLPAALRRQAWTADGVLMALRHVTRPIWGVQFHPESIGTAPGMTLLRNFLELSGAALARTAPVVLESAGGAPLRSPPVAAPPPPWAVWWQRLPDAPPLERLFAAHYAGRPESFWLDSSLVRDGLARFSFMGAPEAGPEALTVSIDAAQGRIEYRSPAGVASHAGDGYAALQALVDLRRCAVVPELPFDFQGGWVGYLGYEMKTAGGLGGRHRAATPDAQMMLVDRLIAFDHATGDGYLVSCGPPAGQAAAEDWMTRMREAWQRLPHTDPELPPAGGAAIRHAGFVRDRRQYGEDIAACHRELLDGESYEICLTNLLRLVGAFDPWSLYRRLRRCNPAPCAAWLRFGALHVLSSSPERFLRVGADRVIESRPIKGTARRGADAVADAALAKALADSEKERAEHLMIVDLMRNDLGRVCIPGSVAVPVLMAIEPYATVHQMVSTVRGHLRPDVPVMEAVRQAFPPGSMTGAPKRRTLEILDRLETEARGIYSGALGYIGLNGCLDLSVVIRTAVIQDREAVIGSGGAIVVQSEAEAEWAEMQLKTRALMAVFDEGSRVTSMAGLPGAARQRTSPVPGP